MLRDMRSVFWMLFKRLFGRDEVDIVSRWNGVFVQHSLDENGVQEEGEGEA